MGDTAAYQRREKRTPRELLLPVQHDASCLVWITSRLHPKAVFIMWTGL